MESPIIKRKLSKLTRKTTSTVTTFSGELDIKHRILAIHESIKALKKKVNSITYNNFDPSFSHEKSLDV
jgi:hypothetical protein